MDGDGRDTGKNDRELARCSEPGAFPAKNDWIASSIFSGACPGGKV